MSRGYDEAREVFRLGAVRPEDAITAFVRRNLIEVTFNWLDIWNEEHAAAFTVSRLHERQLLEFIRDELSKALTTGTSLGDFARVVRKRLQDAGWWGRRELVDDVAGKKVFTTFDPTRLKLIYDTNLRQAYNAGTWAQFERTKDRFPLLVYKTRDDGLVRPAHRAWHNLVLPIDHPFWDTHAPQNGYRCRCELHQTSERDLERRRARGEVFKMEAPPIEWVEVVNKRTGEIRKTPRGIDPGFAYNPGKVRQMP